MRPVNAEIITAHNKNVKNAHIKYIITTSIKGAFVASTLNKPNERAAMAWCHPIGYELMPGVLILSLSDE